MLARLRSRLTFANVCSFLALLIALGTGSAYAANTVFSTDIVDGEVKTADIANNAVRSSKIGDGQVKAPDIAADAVASANVVNESLTASDLGTDSVQATEVANNSIDSGEIANDSLFASDLARLGHRERDSRTVASATSTSPATPSPARRWRATR